MAFCEIVIVVASTIDATVAPVGMPVPLTVMPTVIPAVEARLETVTLPFAVVPASTNVPEPILSPTLIVWFAIGSTPSSEVIPTLTLVPVNALFWTVTWGTFPRPELKFVPL